MCVCVERDREVGIGVCVCVCVLLRNFGESAYDVFSAGDCDHRKPFVCVCVCHTLTKSAMLLNSGQTLVTVLYHRDQCHTISPDLHQSEAHLWLIIKLHNTSVRHYWKVEISTQTQSHSRSYATLNFK